MVNKITKYCGKKSNLSDFNFSGIFYDLYYMNRQNYNQRSPYSSFYFFTIKFFLAVVLTATNEGFQL